MTNRVWFDARSLSRGYTSGWERYVRELCKHLPELIDISLWTPNTSSRFALILSDYLNRKSQKGHELVHYPTYPPTKIDSNLKKIITVHDLTWWHYPKTSSLLGKYYYKKNMKNAIFSSDLIITPSYSVKEEISKTFSIPLEKIKNISHGNSLPQGFERKSSRPYFLSIGTIEPRKNLDFYSKAIEKSHLTSDFDFLHVGRVGWGKIPNNLQRVTAQSDQELANLIINARVVVVPSLYEGFGLPILEAHAQGIPVIMSNISALKELSNKNDILFNLNNLEELVDSLHFFAKNHLKLDPSLITDAKNSNWLSSAKSHVEAYLGVLNG